MDKSLQKFAYHLVGETECYQCKAPFSIQDIQLTPVSSGEYDLVADYECKQCATPYQIGVVDQGHRIELEAFDESTNSEYSEFPSMGRSERKFSLQEKLHPARDLVEGLHELQNGLVILQVNDRRISDRMDVISNKKFNEISDSEMSELGADIHNYLSSAYSFHRILSTVTGDLPTGGPVESRLDYLEKKYRPIEGLRIYAQHYLSLPLSIEHIAGDRVSVTVELENVDEISTDVTEDKPDGYKRGADHHYGSITEGYIEIDKKVHEHYNASKELVEQVWEFAGEERKEELEDYAEKTDPTIKGSHRNDCS